MADFTDTDAAAAFMLLIALCAQIKIENEVDWCGLRHGFLSLLEHVIVTSTCYSGPADSR